MPWFHIGQHLILDLYKRVECNIQRCSVTFGSSAINLTLLKMKLSILVLGEINVAPSYINSDVGLILASGHNASFILSSFAL